MNSFEIGIGFEEMVNLFGMNEALSASECTKVIAHPVKRDGRSKKPHTVSGTGCIIYNVAA